MFQRKLFSERINPEQISTIINQEVPQIFTYSNYTHCNIKEISYLVRSFTQ